MFFFMRCFFFTYFFLLLFVYCEAFHKGKRECPIQDSSKCNYASLSTSTFEFGLHCNRLPQLPIPPCRQAFHETQARLAVVVSAHHCRKSGRCFANFEKRLQIKSRPFARRYLIKHLPKTAVEYPEYGQRRLLVKIPYPREIFSRPLTREDWRLADRWEVARTSSALYGLPTLRVERLLNTTNASSSFCPAIQHDKRTVFARQSACPVCSVGGTAEKYMTVVNKHLEAAASRFHQCVFPDFKSGRGFLENCGQRWPVTPRLRENEVLLTVLDPLGSGREAEVWRVCVPGGGKFHSGIVALKVFRRVAQPNLGELSTALPRKKNKLSSKRLTKAHLGKRMSSARYRRIMRAAADWNKMVISVKDALRFVDVISPETILYPNEIMRVTDSNFLDLSTELRIGKKSVLYNGVAALLELARQDLSSIFAGREYPLPLSDVACIGRQVLEMLQQFDRAGIVWMDCKAANLLVFEHNVTKVGDPGITRCLGSLVTKPGVGTPNFRPPEAFRLPMARKLSVRSSWSVYSLGVTLYLAVVGSVPWTEKQIASYGKSERLHELVLENSSSARRFFTRIQHESPRTRAVLQDVLSKTLHHDPESRITLAELQRHPFWSLCKGTFA